MRGMTLRWGLVSAGLCAVSLAASGCYDFGDVGPPDLFGASSKGDMARPKDMEQPADLSAETDLGATSDGSADAAPADGG